MDSWTQEQIDKFIVIEQAFEEFCGADPELSKLNSTNPGPKSEKFKDWYNQYNPAHAAATERFVKLFREKILVAWVLRYDEKNDDGVTLPHEYWAQSIASLTLTKGKVVEADLLDEQHIHLANRRVVLRKKDREKWINGAAPDSQHGPQGAAETTVPEGSEDEPAPPRKKPTKNPRGAGRKKGTGSFEKEDEPLLKKMESLVAGGAARWDAALTVVGGAPGKGKDESRAKRLLARYMKQEKKNSV